MKKVDDIIDEDKVFAEITRDVLVGYLGIITPDGYPRVVPMNFAADGKTIYLHGEKHGETFAAIKSGSKVTFSIDRQYSLLPSYWTSKINACATTMFYKSALVKGTGQLVENPEEFVRGLQLFMDKYQPEGQYVPMSPDEKVYRGLFKSTAVYRIIPDMISVKVNFRQKKSDRYKLKLIKKLEERGSAIDIQTANEIRRMINEQEDEV